MNDYDYYLDNPPKVFISYSWSSKEHKEKVLNLAKRLKSDGVEVILDRWHLQEGQDKYEFMETSVKSPGIQKVLIICDKKYSEKANDREGGVGTETQIITPKLYEDTKQTKFLPVIFERKEDGKEYVPIYLDGRMYFDLSNPDIFENEYLRLIRNIFERPEDIEPSLGNPPSFIFSDKKDDVTKTLSKFNQFNSAIQNENKNAIGIYETYLENFVSVLQNDFYIEVNRDDPIDELVVDSINAFIPYRDEFIELINIINKYKLDERYIDGLFTFFEKLMNMCTESKNGSFISPPQKDNYKFICWELFLYTIALFIQNRNIVSFIKLTHEKYYMEYKYEKNMVFYTEIRQYIKTLEDDRKKRLNINKRSVAGEELIQRHKKDININLLIQADLILYFLSENVNDNYRNWFPITLVYANQDSCKFEVFLHAENISTMNMLLQFVGLQTKDELKQQIENNSLLSDRYFSMAFMSLATITNFTQLFRN